MKRTAALTVLRKAIKQGPKLKREKPPALTKRETDILHLIWAGYTSIEAGKALKISRRTVEQHRANVMRKYRAHNTATMLHVGYAAKVIGKLGGK